ncbi:hypothetical protein V8F20_011697 [Naviculisporaceae sp. PSN 640]
MEGFRKQGVSDLSQLWFLPRPNEHELITVNDSEPPVRVPLPLHEILQRFQGEQSGSSPAIRLVKLHIRHPQLFDLALDPPALNASKEEILQLWDEFDLDPTVFQLLTKGIQGYYQQHDAKSRKTGVTKSHYLLCSYVYCLIWAYSPQTKHTDAVMLVRPEDHLGKIDFGQWLSALALQTSLAHHPLCLFLTTIMQSMHVATAGAKGAQALINDIEWKTGFYPWMPVPMPYYLIRGHVAREHSSSATDLIAGHDMGSSSHQKQRFIPSTNHPRNLTLDELSIASRNIGAVLVMLEDHCRQLKQLQLAIEAFTNTKRKTSPHSEEEEEEIESIGQALRLITQQIESYNMRLHYLRERGKNQSTVVFNHMTRADTQASISLAKSAKKDSSSMKVIAVMTMAFLPATFLAALFAVPSLKWDDEEKVMQDNFWVFWAFALPATGLVFGLWFLMTPGEGRDVSLMTRLWDSLGELLSKRSMPERTVSDEGGRQPDGMSQQQGSSRASGTAMHSEATIRRLQNFLLNRGGNLGDIELDRPIDLSERHGTVDQDRGRHSSV